MNRKYSRPTTTLILLILTLLGLWQQPANAGEIETIDGKTVITVTVWALPDPASVDPKALSDVAIVRRFVEKYPQILKERYKAKYESDPAKYGDFDWGNVEVRLKPFSGIQVEGVETDLLAIAGDMAPDVLYVNFRKSDTYIQNGFLYPLDKPEDNYVPSMTEDEWNIRVHPAIEPVIRRKGPNGNTHIWSMPYDGALGKVLLYRKDLFEMHNVPFPDENWTWEQMLDACRKLTNPEEDTYGIRFGRGVHESWYWITFLWSAGGEVMVYDEETDKWTCTYDSRAAAKALDYYIKLSAEPWIDRNGKKRSGYAHKDASEGGRKWIEGKIGMYFAYIDEKMFATINPDVTGMAPVPLGYPDENGVRHRGGELNSRMMGLFARIKHPVVRDAAWEFIRFRELPEAQEIRTKILVEGGLGRFVNPRYLKRFGYEDIIRLAPPGWSDTFDIAINTGKPEPYGQGSNLAYIIMTEPLQKAENMYRNGELPENDEARLEVLQQMLRESVAKANRKMIGEIPPREMTLRRITGFAALILVVVAFFFVFRRVFRAFRPEKLGSEAETASQWQFRKYWLAYLCLIPALLTILVWQYIPLAQGSGMAFMDYDIIDGIAGSAFVGVDNFGNVLWDLEGWWTSVWNSLRYSFLVVSLTFLPPVVLAILLQEVPIGTLFFRTVYYLPAVITGLVTMLLWKMFYQSNEHGALNQVVMAIPAIAYIGLGVVLAWVAIAFGRRLWFHEAKWQACIAFATAAILFYTCWALASPILLPGGESIPSTLMSLPGRLFATQPEPYRWLDDRNTAMLACVIPMVWAGMGPGCLIYLAALKGIADDFYEAADIDGASFIDKVLFVVFPILKPLVIINFVGVFIGSWQQSANILAMTGGGAGTKVANLDIFFEAFTYVKMGPATAMAWVLGTMLIGFTVYQLRILSRLEFKTTGSKK